jgi:hypothetical protein
MASAAGRKRARELDTTVKIMREAEDRLRVSSMERFLDEEFAPGKRFYDAEGDLWFVVDPEYKGPGYGFIVIRRDKSTFRFVAQYKVLQ